MADLWREGDTERELLVTGSLSKWLQWSELSHSDAKRQEFLLGTHMGCLKVKD